MVEPTHLKNISQIGSFPQVGDENNKYLKPPPRKATLPGRITYIPYLLSHLGRWYSPLLRWDLLVSRRLPEFMKWRLVDEDRVWYFEDSGSIWDSSDKLPSRELTYPTWEKEHHPFWVDMLVPSKVANLEWIVQFNKPKAKVFSPSPKRQAQIWHWKLYRYLYLRLMTIPLP